MFVNIIRAVIFTVMYQVAYHMLGSYARKKRLNLK